MKLTAGSFRGEELHNVPLRHLKLLLEIGDTLDLETRVLVLREVEEREIHLREQESRLAEKPRWAVVRVEDFQRWREALHERFHPSRPGGSPAAWEAAQASIAMLHEILEARA